MKTNTQDIENIPNYEEYIRVSRTKVTIGML